MINLKKSMDAWGTPEFTPTLKSELESMGTEQLPLQQGLSTSSVALDDNVKVTILDTAEQADHLEVKVGIFYSGIIAGCSCVDDPTPTSEQTEYCEVQLRIKRNSGDTEVTLLSD